MESPAPGVVDPGADAPERSAPAGASPEVAVVSQLPPACPASLDVDDPAPEGGHPKSFCEDAAEEPPAPPLFPSPKLNPLDPLLRLLEPPKLLELPNPDDPFCPEPNPLLDPF